MDLQNFNQQLIDFIADSPTPFHAVESIKSRLDAAGFSELPESDSWSVKAGEGYYLVRNQSSIIAWRQPESFDAGIRMVGAHTDSPCLRVKPTPELYRFNYQQLGVEVYGGALLNPWFDRDLSLAGRVTCKTAAGDLVNKLTSTTASAEAMTPGTIEYNQSFSGTPSIVHGP